MHVVNGLHPDLPFDYYTELLRGFKRIRPEIHLKCFTAVEIAFFADLYGMSDEQVLRELMDAGLDSLPGGGAEVFAERVRRKICHDKADADRWLSIHRIAHRLGMRSNVTMLYGHIETIEERVDHMLRARALQDETGGFQAFIPLAFHPDNNQMRKLPAPSANDTLRVHAVARLMLDNIPHVKAFWIATGVDVAQTALWFGVDDLDGTVQEEKIYHMAGSRTPESMTTADLQRLIRAAGREPRRARHALQRRRCAGVRGVREVRRVRCGAQGARSAQCRRAESEARLSGRAACSSSAPQDPTRSRQPAQPVPAILRFSQRLAGDSRQRALAFFVSVDCEKFHKLTSERPWGAHSQNRSRRRHGSVVSAGVERGREGLD